jgi:hypothetical protein
MGTYRKKPVEIEAVLWTGENWNEVVEFVRATGKPEDFAKVVYDQSSHLLLVSTLEGRVRCSMGDWLLRGVKGEYYPCRADIFEATYDEVSGVLEGA